MAEDGRDGVDGRNGRDGRDGRDEHDILIRISVLLENLTGQVGGLSEKFTKLETQLQEVNHRGLLQQTAIDRLAQEQEKAAKHRGELTDRVEKLEDERLVWKTEFKTLLLIVSPIYGIALIQIGKWVSMFFGTP